MRLCIFSDIHGNDSALTAGVQVMKALKPDGFVFLGDLCGYYPNIDYCFKILSGLPNLISIKGNHDEYFLKLKKDDKFVKMEYPQKYGGIPTDFAEVSKFSDNYLFWLSSLPFSKILNNILIVHGSPDDPINGRIYSLNSFNNIYRPKPPPGIAYILMGHTHYPLDEFVDGVRWINPGSIGQPRSKCPPSFYFLDSEANVGYHVYFNFDRASFAKQINDDPGVTSYSKEVLWRY